MAQRGRLTRPDLFRQLGYRPHPGQIPVHRSTAKRRVMACGTRWGKSMCASMEVVAALLDPCESALGWIVAPTIELTDRIFLLVVDALQTHFADRVVELDMRDRRLVVRNLGGGMSEVRCKSTDQPAALLGAAVDWMVVDEAARVRNDVWASCLGPRLIDRDGWALILSTPRGGGWFCEAFRRGQKKRDPRYESWSSPSWTNPHVDRALIEQERATMSAEAFQREFGAEFAGVPPDPCDTCGGPSTSAKTHIILENGAQPRKCSECGGFVHEDGRTAVPLLQNGKVGSTRIIIVHEGLREPPEMP